MMKLIITLLNCLLVSAPAISQFRGTIQLDKSTFNIGEGIQFFYTVRNIGRSNDTIVFGTSSANPCYAFGINQVTTRTTCDGIVDGGTTSLILAPDSGRTWRITVPSVTTGGRYFLVARLNYASPTVQTDTTWVNIQTTSSLPRETYFDLQFRLEQNYPNPFNPETIIPYQLYRSSDVRLEVYDSSGKRIATLVQGQHSAGRYEVKFSAKNYASGAYHYTLKASGMTQTKKMLFVK